MENNIEQILTAKASESPAYVAPEVSDVVPYTEPYIECFSANDTVTLKNGQQKFMHQLNAGDTVLTRTVKDARHLQVNQSYQGPN